MEVQKVKMYAMYCSALVHRAVELSIVAVVIVRSKFLKNIYLCLYKCLNNSTTLYQICIYYVLRKTCELCRSILMHLVGESSGNCKHAE